MKSTYLRLFLALSSLPAWIAVAADGVDVTVQASAVVQATPPRITITWPVYPSATAMTVHRRAAGTAAWGAGVPIPSPATATAYEDNNVAVGEVYEYKLIRNAPAATGYGYLYVGIERPAVEQRGTVLLIVDDSIAGGLTIELARLQRDLAGDGWQVIRRDVSRTASSPAVRALIQNDYAADPQNVKAVFLFGHVPVPYSGIIGPDGHTDHIGAWPADVYYGDMDGVWTDTTADTNVNAAWALRPENKNVPGDGKFDQGQIPGEVELQVGRVDLSNLPAFSSSETELLRHYLNKNHAFRHKLVDYPRRGLIQDNFAGIGFSSNGFGNFSGFFGAQNINTAPWFPTLERDRYLWAYACSGGYFDGFNDLSVTTTMLAQQDARAAFTMLLGSYFGDWDSQNNFLRAPLASSDALTCAWAGRPNWYFQHMGLGETIGFSTRITQNNTMANYAYPPAVLGANGIHIALMGDPTLRMHTVTPPQAFNGTKAGVFSWTSGGDGVLGYNIYRSATAAGPFTRLNGGGLLAGTTYTDATAQPGATYTYMLRAVKLETGSGTYYNASQGIFTTITVNTPPTLTTVGTLGGAVEDAAFDIPYNTLASAANEADADVDPLSFRVEAVSTGTLTKNGVPVVAGNTLLGSGETWVWTPPPGLSGTGLNAFTVKAWDGIATSANPAQVTIDVTAINEPPQIVSVAFASPNPAGVAQKVGFGVGAVDPDGDELAFTWNFGDGGAARTQTATHVYTAAGVYTATVTIWDHVNAPVQGQVTVTVSIFNSNGGGAIMGGDSDGDGVSDANEIADGTDWLDANSLNRSAMTISTLQLNARFSVEGQDSFAVTGAIQSLPSFDPQDQLVLLNIGGALMSAKLDGKGKGGNARGQIALKTKATRNRQAKQIEVSGSVAVFSARFKNGAWRNDWRDEGMVPNRDAQKEAVRCAVELTLNGRVYAAEVNGLFSATAGRTGKFKNTK